MPRIDRRAALLAPRRRRDIAWRASKGWAMEFRADNLRVGA